MIRPTLETPQLTAGQECRLVIRLSNAGPQVCRGLVFRVRLSPELVALRGQERIEVGELRPGAFCDLALLVRPVQPGAFLLASTNFQYRDSYDRVVVVPQWRQQVAVQPAQLSPEQQAAHDAESHAGAQRWEAAWPLYLQVHDRRQALVCLQRAVQRLRSQGRSTSVAALFLAYAQAVRQIGDPDLGSEPWAIQGLEQAMIWYAQVGQSGEAQQCRELLSYLTRSPLLDVRLVVRADTVFTVGAAGLIAVQSTNCGYGPAREVRLALSGMLERPVEHVIIDLAVGQTETWNASVVPRFSGPCAIKLDAAAHPYGGGAAVTATGSGVVTAQPVGMLEQTTRRPDGSIHLHIENYAAPGATNVTNRDSAIVNRTPAVAGGNQKSAPAPVLTADAGRRYCEQCGALVEPAQRFCSQCGISL
jgi:hypothetical protein